MKISLLLTPALLVAAALGITGCSNDRAVEATVRCEAVSAYQSDVGMLNIGTFSLGEIAMVDHATKRVYRVYGIEPGANDLRNVDMEDAGKTATYAHYEIKIDGNPDDKRKSDIQAIIDNNLAIHLGKYRKTEIVPVEDLINRDPRINADMESVLQNRKDVDFILVSSLLSADTLKISLPGATEKSPQVRLLKTPGYALQVHLDFVKALDTPAMKSGVFFNYTPVTIDPISRRIVIDQGKKMDITRYDQVPSKIYLAPDSL